jgi:transposase
MLVCYKLLSRCAIRGFFSRAERGEIATAGEIQRAFEVQVGHEVNKSTISRLLKRHRWRKPVPRPVHPQAKAEAQEEFKKTFRPALKAQSRHVQQTTSDPS